MTTLSALAADAIMLLHLGYVSFVVWGEALILAGWLRDWNWTRNPLFRAAHLLAILIVVFEAVQGIECPLTTWEYELRQAAGQNPREGAFLAGWVHQVLFFELPEQTFTLLYAAFGMLVVLTWIVAPPRWRAKRDQPSAATS